MVLTIRFAFQKDGMHSKHLARVGNFPDPKRMRTSARTRIISPPPRLKIVPKLMKLTNRRRNPAQPYPPVGDPESGFFSFLTASINEANEKPVGSFTPWPFAQSSHKSSLLNVSPKVWVRWTVASFLPHKPHFIRPYELLSLRLLSACSGRK